MARQPSADRLHRALQIRDAAVQIAEQLGTVGGLAASRFIIGRGAQFSIEYTTSVQSLPSFAETQEDRAVPLDGADGREPATHTLDIWDPETKRKVFNIEWNNDGYQRLGTFLRGEWEDRLLTFELSPHRTDSA